MNVIYKVIGDFENCDFEKVINKINSIFKFLYINEILYLALADYGDYDKQNEVLEEAFQPVGSFVVMPISEKNIMKQQDIAIQWCRENFVGLESQRYEKEQQEKLKDTWRQMDEFEDELIEIYREKLSAMDSIRKEV